MTARFLMLIVFLLMMPLNMILAAWHALPIYTDSIQKVIETPRHQYALVKKKTVFRRQRDTRNWQSLYTSRFSQISDIATAQTAVFILDGGVVLRLNQHKQFVFATSLFCQAGAQFCRRRFVVDGTDIYAYAINLENKNDNQLIQSKDGGISWQKIDILLPGHLTIANGIWWSGFLKSEDLGHHWLQSETFAKRDPDALTIVSPNNANDMVIRNFDALYQSHNGGQTFTRINKKIQAMIYDNSGQLWLLDRDHVLTKEGTEVARIRNYHDPTLGLSLTEGDVWLGSRRSSESYVADNQGINSITLKGAFCLQSQCKQLVVWSDDHLFYSNDFGFTWEDRSPDVPTITTVLKNQSHLFVLAQSTLGAQLYKSDDTGSHWQKTTLLKNLDHPSQTHIDDILIDDQESTIVFHQGRLRRSTDHGKTFTEERFPGGQNLHFIRRHPHNFKRLYISVSDDANASSDEDHFVSGTGLFQSNDEGETWKQLEINGYHRFCKIAFHPFAAERIYLIANQGRGDEGRCFGHLIYTVDDGKNWYSGGLRQTIRHVSLATLRRNTVQVLTTDNRLGFSSSIPSTWQISPQLEARPHFIIDNTDIAGSENGLWLLRNATFELVSQPSAIKKPPPKVATEVQPPHPETTSFCRIYHARKGSLISLLLWLVPGILFFRFTTNCEKENYGHKK